MRLNIKNSLPIYILLLFLGCTTTRQQKLVTAPPVLCQSFPCKIGVESISGDFPTGIKIPLPYWIYLYRYSKNYKIIHFNYDGNPKIKPQMLKIGLWPSKEFNTTVIKGKADFVVQNHGAKRTIYDRTFPRAKCGIKKVGKMGKWKMKNSKILGYFDIFTPRTPFVLMNNLPEKERLKWASFFRCFIPVAFAGDSGGTIVWLRLNGVAAYKWGIPQGSKNSSYIALTKRILRRNRGSEIEVAWVDNKKHQAKLFRVSGPVDLLGQLYKSKLIRKSDMYRIWEELLRAGVTPLQFLKISSQ